MDEEIQENRGGLYKILGASQAATLEEIETAYVNLVKKWPPSQPLAPEKASELLATIAKAFIVLSDPALRKKYDDFTTLKRKNPAGAGDAPQITTNAGGVKDPKRQKMGGCGDGVESENDSENSEESEDDIEDADDEEGDENVENVEMDENLDDENVDNENLNDEDDADDPDGEDEDTDFTDKTVGTHFHLISEPRIVDGQYVLTTSCRQIQKGVLNVTSTVEMDGVVTFRLLREVKYVKGERVRTETTTENGKVTTKVYKSNVLQSTTVRDANS